MFYTREELQRIQGEAAAVDDSAVEAITAYDAAEVAQAALRDALARLAGAPEPEPLPDLPEGYVRPGSIPIGYDAQMILPEWRGGAGTLFSPSQVDFLPNGAARLSFVSKDLSGEMQVIRPKFRSGRRGWIARSIDPRAVLAMFTYHRDGLEIDFEYRGDEVWQMNFHTHFADNGAAAVPMVLPTFAMTWEEVAEWHRYEFDYGPDAVVFYVDGAEVARITPSDYAREVRWPLDVPMETFTSVEWHENWAQWAEYQPCSFEIAGMMV